MESFPRIYVALLMLTWQCLGNKRLQGMMEVMAQERGATLYATDMRCVSLNGNHVINQFMPMHYFHFLY